MDWRRLDNGAAGRDQPVKAARQIELERWNTRGMVLPEDGLRKLLALSDMEGVKVVHWQTHGQPGPDVLRGRFQVTPEVAGRLVERLISEEILLSLEVFPIGIPWPDVINIGFASQGLVSR